MFATQLPHLIRLSVRLALLSEQLSERSSGSRRFTRSDALCLPRVSMHRSAGRLVKVGRVRGRPPDGRQTEPSVNSKAGQHVQDYASPGSNVELEPCRSDRPDNGTRRDAQP